MLAHFYFLFDGILYYVAAANLLFIQLTAE